MSLTVTINGETIVVTPTGARTLAALLAARRGVRTAVMEIEVHPATLARLVSTGLVTRGARWTLATGQRTYSVTLTPTGRTAARQLAGDQQRQLIDTPAPPDRFTR